jgi:hypothetical protein
MTATDAAAAGVARPGKQRLHHCDSLTISTNRSQTYVDLRKQLPLNLTEFWFEGGLNAGP